MAYHLMKLHQKYKQTIPRILVMKKPCSKLCEAFLHAVPGSYGTGEFLLFERGAAQCIVKQLIMGDAWIGGVVSVNTIQLTRKSTGRYVDFLPGVSTRNREPLQSIRPAFFSLLISADMALRSTPK